VPRTPPQVRRVLSTRPLSSRSANNFIQRQSLLAGTRRLRVGKIRREPSLSPQNERSALDGSSEVSAYPAPAQEPGGRDTPKFAEYSRTSWRAIAAVCCMSLTCWRIPPSTLAAATTNSPTSADARGRHQHQSEVNVLRLPA